MQTEYRIIRTRLGVTGAIHTDIIVLSSLQEALIHAETGDAVAVNDAVLGTLLMVVTKRDTTPNDWKEI